VTWRYGRPEQLRKTVVRAVQEKDQPSIRDFVLTKAEAKPSFELSRHACLAVLVTAP
jgi:hypothetical protein